MYDHYKTNEERLDDLNSCFKTVALEPYSDAIIRMILDEAHKEVWGGSGKQRISKGVASNFRQCVIDKLRQRYGRWVNVYDYDHKKFRFRTNFTCIYKTNMGRLYGYPEGQPLDHMYYTTHSFERFEERTKHIPMGLLKLAYARERKTDPTTADILRTMLHNADEFCETYSSIYVNIRTGILVLDKLPKNLLIVKTYLSPDMDYPRDGWFTNNLRCFELVRSKFFIEEMRPKMIEVKDSIILPHIVEEQLDYKTYVEYVSMDK